MSVMDITVKLYAVLQLERFKEKRMSFPDGSTVDDVVRVLNLPAEHVDILLINGVHVSPDQVLREGDVLSILPMVEGG